jgi:hypothetical protein
MYAYDFSYNLIDIIYFIKILYHLKYKSKTYLKYLNIFIKFIITHHIHYDLLVHNIVKKYSFMDITILYQRTNAKNHQ